ncbi:MAG TPA: transposase [Anaerolineaceae bacterium]|nr:transposase [Anaerolineaceae bacterium]
MAQPIIIQDANLRNYLQEFRSTFSMPQWKYFVTGLLGMIHCQASRTLSGMLREVAVWVTVGGLSRFLISPAWSVQALAEARYRSYCAEVAPLVAEAHAQQSAQRTKQRGRPASTVVTGYLILDDSTHVKRYAKHMEGQGWHYSSTDKRSMPGHSLFEGVYVVEGHQYPLSPQMYRQKAVCEREGIPFQSKVDLAEETIQTFEPLPDTSTHVLVDSWYVNKRIWKAVKTRHWDLTGGLKKNHKLRTSDVAGNSVWMQVDEYVEELPNEAFQPVIWPNQEGGQTVYASLIRTRVKKLGACQVLIVKTKPDDPDDKPRFYITTRLTDSLEQVVQAMALRWTVETLFADFKELMGSDQYQLHSAEAIIRFWALGLCLYQFLDSLRHRLKRVYLKTFTLGETLAWVRKRNEMHKINWICRQASAGTTAQSIHAYLAPALPVLSVNC